MIASLPQKTIYPEDHLGLARKFVLMRFGRFLKGPVEDSEEYSFACMVLCKAARTYNPEIGRFSTHAWRYMQTAFAFRRRTQNRHPSPEFVDPSKLADIINENCTDPDVADAVRFFLSGLEENASEKLDKDMLVQHYFHNKTLSQIGKMHGIGRMRVKQRIDRVIAKIRQKCRIENA